MISKKLFKELLIATTSEYGLPTYITGVDLAIDTLFEFIPDSIMSEYIEKYESSSSELTFDSIKFLQPVTLLIAGDDLIKLKNNQSDLVIERIKTKFINLRMVDSQLADLLAEINVATLVGVREYIDLDIETGKKTSKGAKNADILHVDTGWLFEIKNFEFGKSVHEKKFNKIAYETFSKPENTGKQFQVVKGGKIEEIRSQMNGSSLAGQLFTNRKQYAQQIRKANSKFIDGQKAILVLYNVPFRKQAIEAIENWRRDQPDVRRIRAVIIFGRLRPSEGYTRESLTYYLEDDAIDTENFLKTLY